MELLIALAVLYGIQCLVWLPEGSVLFVRPLGAWWVASGPGWRLLHPFPSGPAWLAARLPLVERAGRLYGRAAPTWLSSRGWPDRGAAASPAALAGAEARGSVVRVEGRAFARAVTPAAAPPLARLLRNLGTSDAAQAEVLLARTLAESLSLARYSETLEDFGRATPGLRWSSDLYWTALYVALPGAMLLWESEPALLWALPVLATLHLATLASYAWTFRRLHPEGRGERFEGVLAAALYPPQLLRAWSELRTRALAGFHPAVVAVATLPEAAGRAFLRSEILRAPQPRGSGAVGAAGLAELECRALWQLASEIGESRETLLAEPARHDPRAQGYCPACHVEYVRTSGRCSDCDIELAAYAGT